MQDAARGKLKNTGRKKSTKIRHLRTIAPSHKFVGLYLRN